MPAPLLYDADLRRRINPFDWQDAQDGFGSVFAQRGGFDAVVGNPPYTRAQVMRRYRPEESERYEAAYGTAEGSWDIATLFIERGLRLLRAPRGGDRGGRLGYIVTRTFAETDSARPLRELLAGGSHVTEVIDFGPGMVFAGASAYTILLSLTHQGQREWQLTRVPPPPSPDALETARDLGSPLHARMRAADLTADPWTLSLPSEQALLGRLANRYRNLGQVTTNQVFQGLITGAEDIYRCVDEGAHPTDPALRMVTPVASDHPVAIENAALCPVVAGSTDIKRFRFMPSPEWIIFPYERDRDDVPYVSIAATRMQALWPHTYRWLEDHKTLLQARAPQARTTPWNDENWTAYSRRQNLERFAQPKVLVPYMVEDLCSTADEVGDAGYFVNVSTGGYGIQLPDGSAITLAYLAALLSSELLSWMLRRSSRAFRGGWMGARADNLKALAVAEPSVSDQQAIIGAWEDCRRVASEYDAAVTDSDLEQLGRLYRGTITTFDGLVLDLYNISDDELVVIRST